MKAEVKASVDIWLKGESLADPRFSLSLSANNIKTVVDDNKWDLSDLAKHLRGLEHLCLQVSSGYLSLDAAKVKIDSDQINVIGRGVWEGSLKELEAIDNAWGTHTILEYYRVTEGTYLQEKEKNSSFYVPYANYVRRTRLHRFIHGDASIFIASLIRDKKANIETLNWWNSSLEDISSICDSKDVLAEAAIARAKLDSYVYGLKQKYD